MNTNDILAKLNAELPGVRMTQAEDAQSAYLVRRPTGLIGLDLRIGGGWPAGGFCEVWGKNNLGKNMICYYTIAMNQRIHGDNSRVAYIGIEENGMNKDFARLCGVRVAFSDEEINSKEEGRGVTFTDNERAFLKDQVGDVVIVDAANAEDALDAICKMTAYDHFQVIILDSIAQLLVADEEDLAVGESGMNQSLALSKRLAEFSRKFRRAIFERIHTRPNLTTVLGTNQITAKINTFGGGGEQEKGGNAIRHLKLVSVRLYPGKNIPEQGALRGRQVTFKVTKGKAGCPHGGQGTLRNIVHPDYEKGEVEGFQVIDPMIMQLKQAGLLTVGGGYWDLPIWDVRKRGRPAFLKALADIDPEWWYNIELYREVLHQHGIPLCTTWAEVDE